MKSPLSIFACKVGSDWLAGLFTPGVSHKQRQLTKVEQARACVAEPRPPGAQVCEHGKNEMLTAIEVHWVTPFYLL